MALTEIKIDGQIELVGSESYRIIRVREDNQIYRDGALISSGNFHRHIIVPGTLTSTPVQVVDSLPTTPDGLTDGDVYYQATDTETIFTATDDKGNSFAQLVTGQRGLYVYRLDIGAGRAWTLVSTSTDVPATYDLYVRTNLTSYSDEIQVIAGVCWDNSVHSAYESSLRS
ncbi:MAG: hypothetical protein K0U41_06960 [Gammaproteobacteria bacterium]|nr:hypothetical protein [Gammaproteobacteria bacterium]